MTIESRLELLPQVRESILTRAREAGFDERSCEDIALCVHEAVANAIQHGNGSDPARRVRVTWADDGEGCAIEVVDEGPGFGPLAGRPPPPAGLEERGRGLRLIQALMDDVELARDRGYLCMRRSKSTSGWRSG